MRKLLAASILVHAAILGAPASAAPVQMICTIDAPTTIPVAVWLPAGNICYVNGIVPVEEVPVVMMPERSPIVVSQRAPKHRSWPCGKPRQTP